MNDHPMSHFPPEGGLGSCGFCCTSHPGLPCGSEDRPLHGKRKESWWEDLPKEERCVHAQHHPPSHMVFPPDKIYHHICPGCGHETIVRPSGIHWMA